MNDEKGLQPATPISPEFQTQEGVVSQLMVDDLKKQRSLLLDFVSSQMVKGVDYGTVPGTKKNVLFKPGAEKLRALFSLSVQMDLRKEEIDRKNNFAIYTYKSKVLDRSGRMISECEGTTNSQEKKYKERTVWENGVSHKEETPIFDILNTLSKMAQKRAFVGAIILACAASDFFTQDIDDPEDARQVGAAPRTRKKASVPGVKTVSNQPKQNNQSAQDQAPESVPLCCGQPMIVSKFVDRDFGHAPWYCLKCKTKTPRETSA